MEMLSSLVKLILYDGKLDMSQRFLYANFLFNVSYRPMAFE
jgi:hypothetical protein